MITYAQNFEDIMLARLFQGQQDGFYIDVGAWHPDQHSVTKHFYDLGWSGVNVEPILQQHELFALERPRDRNLNVAAGKARGRIRFFECTDLTALSTASEQHAQELRERGHAISSYDVEMVPLNDIMQGCEGREIDFLKLDVEGFEGEILQAADWRRFRPRVLLIEATLPAVKIEDWDNINAVRHWDHWEPRLLASGYRFAWYDGLSRFYVRDEDAALAGRLTLPPCVHDEIEWSDVHRLRTELAALAKDREDVLSINHRLAEDVDALQKDQTDKAAVIERLDHDSRRQELLQAQAQLQRQLAHVDAEREAVTRDRDDKLALVERMGAEMSTLSTTQAALQDANQGLREALARSAVDFDALAKDRAEKLAVINRLHPEIEALSKSQRELLQANRHLKVEMERSLAELGAVAADRTQMAEKIAQLRAEVVALTAHQAQQLAEEQRRQQQQLDNVHGRLSIQQLKLRAKDEVIHQDSIRDLERKALLKGSADLLYYSRRQHVPPGYGDFTPPTGNATGLHIAVDTLEIVFGVSGGVETYMKMLTSALLESGYRVTLICLPDQKEPLQRKFQDRVGYFVMRKSSSMGLSIRVLNRLQPRKRRLSAVTSMATFSRLAEDIGADILHSPVQIFSKLDFRLPSVLNLHDLQHLHFPENFRPSDIEARNYLYGLSANLADAIIVSSDFVCNDLVQQMGVPASKVFTVPVTWDPLVVAGLETFSAHQAAAAYGLPALYAIYPAQFWPHKNHVRLVEALRIVRDRLPQHDLKLVLTGFRGHTGWPQVEETIRRLGLEADVVCLDHVPVEHLAGLYKGAVYCVMPSTFEASSYPVIEAQVLGVPAMCSNVTSLPELVQDDAGLLFDPFNAVDIADKMAHWLTAPEERALCAQRAFAKVMKEHSLVNYATGVRRAYQHVLE